MPRTARVVAVGYPHHVTQRGNYGQDIFTSVQDYRQYLAWAREYCEMHHLKVWAYCLMTNHVHFVVVPEREDSLARTFNTLHMRYSQYVNKREGLNGHLWQGRFFSCILDERHMYAAVRYVERNPVRAGLVKRAQEYKWSSAPFHTGLVKNLLVSEGCPLINEIDDWKEYLLAEDDPEAVEAIRVGTRTGCPVGAEMVNRMEEQLGLMLRRRRRGRPARVVK